MSIKLLANSIPNLLRISCLFVFTGRAWQHLLWDSPFRTFFWDQGLLEGIVTTFSDMTWFEYVTSPSTDHSITILTRAFGIFYLFMAILTLIAQPRMRKLSWLYGLSSFFLAVLAFFYCKEKFYHTAQFFEYAIQFLTPVFFSLSLFKDITRARLVFYMKIAVTLTFISHGLYAFEYYPRPGVFVDMTVNILGVSETKAHQFLTVAGLVDFVLAIGIFLPRYGQYFLLYAALWGFVTAIARTWSNLVYDPLSLSLMNQYLHQTIYRLPHGMIPMIIFLFPVQDPVVQKSG
ncbi:hypothetical protein FNH22_29410 [Fulvivirga sp. M361]|uniref:hypothetical protein n=1 Tax=Fulvivirga sp. M361 TaxID=2594266 RepID=UPI001179C1CD|nr:hypothetical protein [Fulvivirga sp. M361]TRX48294.1 hypothetical protein FNH22_29410 [Fulvivirga sp. M361]